MTERTANEALAQGARSSFVEGHSFRKVGPLRTYRKPSLLVRIARFLGL